MTYAIRDALLCAAVISTLATSTEAATFNVFVTFDQTNGEDLFAAPIEASDGNIYGTTTYGGKANKGVVYRLTPQGVQTVLYSFCSKSGCKDGAYPGWLTQGTDGNFYGQTYQGGAHGQGTVFELAPDGTITTHYSFCSQSNCADGALPQSALVQATGGSFYGTTVIGGANGEGTIFKFTPGGGVKVMHDFCSQAGCADGAQPNIGLTLASDGNFFGVAAEGGNTSQCPYSFGCGTVFRFSPDGKFKTLYTFCTQSGCPDGGVPQGLLVEAHNGDLYGTTDGGGAGQLGTAFRISAKGRFTLLHSFCSQSCAEGGIPYAGLIQASDGNFYGTTDVGGAGDDNCFSPSGCGVIFQLSIKAKGEATAHSAIERRVDGRSVKTTLFGHRPPIPLSIAPQAVR